MWKRIKQWWARLQLWLYGEPLPRLDAQALKAIEEELDKMLKASPSPKIRTPQPKEEGSIVCPVCMRIGIPVADEADYGYWLIIPTDPTIEIHLTCGECAWYGRIYGMLMDGTTLECAGYNLKAPIPYNLDESVTLLLQALPLHANTTKWPHNLQAPLA